MKVGILDKNDNHPVFVFKEPFNNLIKDKYLATLSTNTQVKEKPETCNHFIFLWDI